MRVLVTGNQGYIGTVLADRLLAAGHKVVGLDIGWFRECILGPPPTVIPTMRMDVRDVLTSDLAGFDAVIHLAALSNDALGNLNPVLTDDINHLASVRLAAKARNAGVTRFLLSSSCSIYGIQANGIQSPGAPLGERADFAPVTPYANSKILAEQEIAALATGSFSPIFLRNATAYGFSPRMRGDIIVNDLVASALLTDEVRLLSDGRAWRPLMHVEDISDAFIALLETSTEIVRNKAFNVAQTSENYLIRDVADLIADRIPGTQVTFSEGCGSDPRNYRVSGDLLAATVPNFKPKWTVASGVDQLISAYHRHGLSVTGLGERFLRIRRLNELLAVGRVGADLRWQ